MLEKNKIFKNFYTFATISLIGTSAIYAKDSISIPAGTLIKDQQKLMNKSSKSTDSVNKIKGTLNDDLDLDFDFDKQRKSEDSIFKEIKDKAPYIAMTATPSLAVVAYSTFQKILEKIRAKEENLKNQNSNENVNYKINENQGNNSSITDINNNENQGDNSPITNINNNENQGDNSPITNISNNENQGNNSSITDINNNENQDNNSSITDINKDKNKDVNGYIYFSIIAFLLIIFMIISFGDCNSNENCPEVAERDPINIKECSSSNNNNKWNIYENRNKSLKGYIKDVHKRTDVGAHVHLENNCFILSGIYTQFCISLKKMNEEIDDIVNMANTGKLNIRGKGEAEENKIRIFISILKKRLDERSKEEPDRFIWKHCLEELNGLINPRNKGKLKNFVTCALNVILMNRLSWNGFMQVPGQQYNQENNLFGLRVKNTVVDGEKYRFRSRYDLGSPADALGGMGIRLTDVGMAGFDYTERSNLVPENDFPYRQVLDRTSNFVTMQYDKENGFKIVDRTWSKHNSVTIDLGKNLGICLNKNENKNESPVILYENGYVEYDVVDNYVKNEQNAKTKYGDIFLKCEKNDGGVEIYEGNKRIKSFKSKQEYFEKCPNGVSSKYKIIQGGENYTVTLRKKIPDFEMPEEKAEANFNSANYKAEEKSGVMVNPIPKDFQKKRMYIGAIGYVKGGAAGGGGHCQTLEPKYKWNNEKGYYEIVYWIDRDCLGDAGKVISNEDALDILKDRLGSYNGRKDHTCAGACRLITEQVIDDCPEQYCFNNDKAEHTEEREKQLKKKRSQGNYKTVQEINSVKDILEQIKKGHPDWFPGGETPNEKNNNLLGKNNLIENEN